MRQNYCKRCIKISPPPPTGQATGDKTVYTSPKVLLGPSTKVNVIGYKVIRSTDFTVRLKNEVK